MRKILAVMACTLAFNLAGCAGGPAERPPETVRGSTFSQQAEREEIWKEHYKNREKEALERMDKPAEEELSD